MDVSLEAYRNIVRSVGRRSDIAALCGVSRAFRNAAERALYNTLTLSDEDPRLCATLTGSPRIAALVVALTKSAGSTATQGRSSLNGGTSPLPRLDDYWSAVAGALRNATRLRHLTIDIADPADSGNAWVLGGCVFQLRTFHCDFDWDHALRAFLGTQRELRDLSLRDYLELEDTPDVPPAPDDRNPTASDAQDTIDASTTALPHTLDPPIPSVTHDTTTPLPQPAPPPLLPVLAALECTFSEAAVALVPRRPLSRLKTCFSRPDPAGKRAELVALVGALRRSAAPIRALDLADASYTESGTMELLHRVAHARATSHELRYLGTLVLPVGGRKRLQFYGLLMRLHALRCVELDVSAWKPAPTSSPALRALAAELRLYCPDVDTVVFVHEFERTVVTAAGTGVLRIDDDASPELFWREI
ncbi:hypothetical protein B0H19DRAFT_1313536 [Mycena capillaripes]|nr:hypothetical protein B0H19DRAFT_1313536 [Mycena capillaripes]